MGRIIEVLAIGAVGVILAAAFLGPHSEVSAVGREVISLGESDTGAVNLVTAIYLGYRAFDTLGETIVLLLAVGGVSALLGTRK